MIHDVDAGADPGEVKWVNFHPPFLSPLLSFFFLSLKYRNNIWFLWLRWRMCISDNWFYQSIYSCILSPQTHCQKFTAKITTIHPPFQNPGSAPGITRNCFTFRSEFSRHPTSRWVFIINERVNESISWSIFNATRTGKYGSNKIMRTGNGFNKGLGLGSRKGKYCLKQLEHAFGWNLMFAACVWDLKHNSSTQVVY